MEAFTGKRTAPGSGKYTHTYTHTHRQTDRHISDGKIGFLLGKLTRNIKSLG